MENHEQGFYQFKSKSMKRITVYFILLLTCLTGVATNAQSISGVVSDEFGPLPLVEIKISGTDQVVQTDENGIFVIAAPSEGTFELEANYHFYKPTKVIGLRLKDGESGTLNFTMETETLKEEVIVLDASNNNSPIHSYKVN